MKFLGVIPARYASTRFPGKLLKPILGKPLILWVIEGVLESQILDQVIVATDHQEIYDLAIGAGVQAVMTDPHLPSGSDRVWEVVKPLSAEYVINIQGDEPLVTGALVDSLAQTMLSHPEAPMGTLATDISLEELKRKSVVKVILNKKNSAIYFSRFSIPYSREDKTESPFLCFKHIGMYAYKKNFLKSFCEEGATEIEKLEGLEQLRALYLGAQIQVAKVKHQSLGVDTEEDIFIVESMLKHKMEC